MMQHPGNQAEEPGGRPPVGAQPPLVLPAPPDSEYPMPGNKYAGLASSGKYPAKIRPEHLVRPAAKPVPRGGPLKKLGYFWHKDPAYKAFIIAIAFVLVAAIFFVSLAGITFFGNAGVPGNYSLSENPAGGASPTGTVDLHPVFPTPGGANGSTQSSQPPAQKTPVLQQTPSPTPPPSPGPGGPLTVTITNIPNRVNNFSLVEVGVSASQGGVSVRIHVTYNPPSSPYTSMTVQTDNNGNATLPWYVGIFLRGKNSIATVVAVAIGPNGQVVRSTPVTVIVVSRGA
ncbi:MAG TPA: hypothetical protein VKV20_07145 [Ktedonobacteraceae bacterium]|jgi:hypothetical protein|nr:hypothetical protein [Ktedonobacteraceae bacterium]